MLSPGVGAPSTAPGSPTLLLVGNPGVVHVGAHLRRAAVGLGLPVAFADTERAFDGPGWLRRLDWRLRGRRPPRLRAFSQAVTDMGRALRPSYLLSTGLAPLDARALAALGDLGIRRLNYLTDDPWNPAHRAPWFAAALPLYDYVFSPRRANLGDLRQLGCRQVCYLPFAYTPEVHYPDPPTAEEQLELASDVVFAGGADADRVPYIAALAEAGLSVALYGGYWERFRETRRYSRGLADPRIVRKAVSSAKVALCLVRRSNRDGHAMRTFELAAMGGCMLVEDTAEHREIFGPEGQTVIYFGSIDEMLRKAAELLRDEQRRQRLSRAVHRLVTRGRHTYRDRLIAMLDAASEG